MHGIGTELTETFAELCIKKIRLEIGIAKIKMPLKYAYLVQAIDHDFHGGCQLVQIYGKHKQIYKYKYFYF